MNSYRFPKGIAVGLVFGGVLTAGLVAQSEKQPLNILIEQTAPGAYVVFLRTYLSDYKLQGESGTRAIFRLHNNYRFPITVDVYNVEDEDMAVDHSNAKVNVVGVDYDLSEYSGRGQPQTVRHFSEEIMTMVDVDPGDDLYFSVPVEHLTSSTEIWIPFKISDEVMGTKGGLPPQHFAVFWGSHMPEVKKREK